VSAFLLTILAGVLVALIVAGILWAVRWLADGANRTSLTDRLRTHACRHEWEVIDDDLGGGLRLVSKDANRCRKCGARR